jgi:hypothetical protein
MLEIKEPNHYQLSTPGRTSQHVTSTTSSILNNNVPKAVAPETKAAKMIAVLMFI